MRRRQSFQHCKILAGAEPVAQALRLLGPELAEPRPSQRQIEQRRVSSSEDTPEQFRGKDPTVRRGQRAPHLTTYTNENGLVVIERVIRHVSPQTQPQRYSEPHVNR